MIENSINLIVTLLHERFIKLLCEFGVMKKILAVVTNLALLVTTTAGAQAPGDNNAAFLDGFPLFGTIVALGILVPLFRKKIRSRK